MAAPTPTEINRELRGHAFYPAADELNAVPHLYGTETIRAADKVMHIHYFAGACDWWVAEIDPIDFVAFGYACLGDPASAEWGYIPLVELEQTMVRPWGVPLVVERDLARQPKPAAECRLPGRT